MLITLLNDINTLKSTDNATPIELAIMNDAQEFVNLSEYKNINISIGKNGVIYSSVIPEILDDNKTMSFTLDGNLPFGKYIVEVNLIKQDDTVHVAPNRGDFPFTIEKSLNEVGKTVTLLSVQQLITDMAVVRKLSEKSNADVTEALKNINELLETANGANEKANEVLIKANEALPKASEASEVANIARLNAEESLVTARQANQTANTALETANSSVAKVDNVVEVANEAKTTADQVRADFDELTSGSSNAEIIEARGAFKTLNERLDSTETKILVAKEEITKHQADLSHVHWLGSLEGTNTLTAEYTPITSYEEGLGISFKIITSSTGATSLNINGLGAIPILKSNGNTESSLKANGVYTLRYSDGNFILQGEGGDSNSDSSVEYGTATASDVRKGTTIATASGVIDGVLDLTNLLPVNIKSGVDIGGVVGSYSADGGSNPNLSTVYGMTIFNGAEVFATSGDTSGIESLIIRFRGTVKINVNKGFALSIEEGGLIYAYSDDYIVDYKGIYSENSTTSDTQIYFNIGSSQKVSTTEYRVNINVSPVNSGMMDDNFTLDLSKFKLIAYV